MPLKNFTTGTIPYLEKYTPYNQLPVNAVEVNNVADMVTYSVQPNVTPTRIEYKLGSVQSYVGEIVITNITLNTNIELNIKYPKNIFYLNFTEKLPVNETDVNTREVVKILTPSEVLNIGILTNNSILDLAQIRSQIVDIKITVKNISTNRIATTQRKQQNANTESFPTRVRLE